MSSSMWIIKSLPLWLLGALSSYAGVRVLIRYFALPAPASEEHGRLFLIWSAFLTAAALLFIIAARWRPDLR